MDRQITLLYKIEKQNYESWRKDDESIIEFTSDGEYRRPWCKNSIQEDLLNLQIPLDSTDLKIVIFSDCKIDVTSVFPRKTQQVQWKLKELGYLAAELKITAGQWKLNDQPLEHWKFPKSQFVNVRYLYTYPVVNAPSVNEQNNIFPSWVDYQYKQNVEERRKNDTSQQLKMKRHSEDENQKKNIFSWVDFEYQKNCFKSKK